MEIESERFIKFTIREIQTEFSLNNLQKVSFTKEETYVIFIDMFLGMYMCVPRNDKCSID
jgi:hypothetical protein